MNQILSTKLELTRKTSEKKIWYKFQFIISISFMIVLIFCGIFYFYRLERKEDFSNNLIENYNIYRLYNVPNQETNDKSSDNVYNELFGIIEIPKIDLYYPVFSHLTEDLLKISPCKFYGNTPDVNGNICIAGHNYDNSLFFSKISNLSQNDEIYLYDNNGNQYVYLVYNIYEVAESDLSPILNYEENEKILTLVTCNNFNSNRIIVQGKAEQKEHD